MDHDVVEHHSRGHHAPPWEFTLPPGEHDAQQCFSSMTRTLLACTPIRVWRYVTRCGIRCMPFCRQESLKASWPARTMPPLAQAEVAILQRQRHVLPLNQFQPVRAAQM